jgi:ankyrin repeat protein
MASLLMAYKELGNYEAKCSIVESLMRLDPTLANVSHLEYGTPLTFAIKLPDPSIAQMMLRLGADPNAPAEEYPESLTPLVVAIESGRYSLAESLLAANADPNIPQSIGGSHTRRSVSVLYVAMEKVPFGLFNSCVVVAGSFSSPPHNSPYFKRNTHTGVFFRSGASLCVGDGMSKLPFPSTWGGENGQERGKLHK